MKPSIIGRMEPRDYDPTDILSYALPLHLDNGGLQKSKVFIYLCFALGIV